MKPSAPVCIGTDDCIISDIDAKGGLYLALRLTGDFACTPDGLALVSKTCLCKSVTLSSGGPYTTGLI